MRQGIVLPETPRQRRELAGLEEDLLALPQRGRPLPLRLRNFRPAAESYLAATRGPLPYMLRLHEIEVRTAELQTSLEAEWRSLAGTSDGDPAGFAARWRARAETVAFDEVNELIERHNRWYPAESRLPLDPRRGDYVLVNGRDYRLRPLDAGWVLERFPPALEQALAAAP